MLRTQRFLDHVRRQARYRDSTYDGVAGNDAEFDEQIITTSTQKSSFIRRALFPNVWFVTTVLMLALLASRDSGYGWSQVTGSYEKGFDTELAALKPAIQVKQTRFSNAIRAHENGTLYPFFDPTLPKYVGAPTPEIDEAWDTLLYGRYIRFKDDEVSTLNEDTWLPKLEPILQSPGIESTGFYGGPDMLHSLHCVNALRKHVYLDYYESHMTLPAEYRRMHIDHCVDQLRQAILCHGDITPVTLKPVWVNSTALYYLGQTERTHTCRNGDSIKEWVKERGAASGYLGTT